MWDLWVGFLKLLGNGLALVQRMMEFDVKGSTHMSGWNLLALSYMFVYILVLPFTRWHLCRGLCYVVISVCLSVCVCLCVSICNCVLPAHHQSLHSNIILIHPFLCCCLLILPHATSDCHVSNSADCHTVCTLQIFFMYRYVTYERVFTRDLYRYVCYVWTGFYARPHICYSSYMLSPVRPSVRSSLRLSVCLSDGWIIEKRLKLGLWNFHHSVAPFI